MWLHLFKLELPPVWQRHSLLIVSSQLNCRVIEFMCWKTYNCDYIMNVTSLTVESDFFVSTLLAWKSLEGSHFLSLGVLIIYIANERVKRKKAKAIERDNTMAKIKINIPAWLILEHLLLSTSKHQLYLHL